MPRTDAPPLFTVETMYSIIALACDVPSASDRTITHWTCRAFEYIRHGTCTLMAGFDVVTGTVLHQDGPIRTDEADASFAARLIAGCAQSLPIVFCAVRAGLPRCYIRFRND